MDVFILGGTRLEGDPPGATNRLYRNNRDGTFTDVTAKAGLAAAGWASGVCVGDYNNDGFEDLFCTYFGQNRLYRNNGDGTFTDVTKAAGLWNAQPRWGAGCSFVDYDRDGHLDLFVSNYVRFSFEHAPVPGANSNCNWKGIPVLCGPRGLPHGRHSLYRNNGDGTFTDVTEQAGITAATPGYGMTVVAADLDEDGWPDIYVACDSTPSLLFMNNRDGTFREEGVLRGVALSDDGGEQAGMGVGIGDYDRRRSSRSPEDALCRRCERAVSQRRDRAIRRCDAAGARGGGDALRRLGRRHRRSRQRWPSRPLRRHRQRLSGGRAEAAAVSEQDAAGGVPEPRRRHVRAADRGSGPGCGGGALQPRLRVRRFRQRRGSGRADRQSERAALPASQRRRRLEPLDQGEARRRGLESQRDRRARAAPLRRPNRRRRPSASQSSFYPSNDPRLHFGMGSSLVADLEIYWPNGRHDTFKGIKANQLVTIREGVGVVASRGWPAK